LELKKLASGYYSGQKTEAEKPYEKPENLKKCSHGGLLDMSSSTIEATGGINKDSGYLLFSPHAHLHLKAAELAIKHTEIYFNQIREQIGDAEFAKFLHLEIDRLFLVLSSVKCSAWNINSNQFYAIILLINFFFIYFIYLFLNEFSKSL